MRSISTRDARANFADLVGSVYYTKEPVMVKKKDKIYAVIISPQQFEEYQKAAQDRLFALMDKVHAQNADVSETEVLQDVNEAVETIRQQQYEKRG